MQQLITLALLTALAALPSCCRSGSDDGTAAPDTDTDTNSDTDADSDSDTDTDYGMGDGCQVPIYDT